MSELLTEAEIQAFRDSGYLVAPQMATGDLLEHLKQVAQQQVELAQQPYELEASTGYPGAPESETTEGGRTIRRLLGAYQRHALWQQWSTGDAIKYRLQQLFGNNKVYLSQAHHNCLMTKKPEFSSDTGWHQDIRYWSFEHPELISVWLALGNEQPENGSLWVIPGSHRLQYTSQQFDERIFFKDDLNDNQALIEQAAPVELQAGDVLFFDCKLLHRASRNNTQQTKLSLVFTYHCSGNNPLAGTRSAQMPEIYLG